MCSLWLTTAIVFIWPCSLRNSWGDVGVWGVIDVEEFRVRIRWYNHQVWVHTHMHTHTHTHTHTHLAKFKHKV